MNLSVHKVPTVFQILNTIVVQQEYDPIIYVQCNDSMMRDVLVDNRVGVNMIIIPTYYNAYLIPFKNISTHIIHLSSGVKKIVHYPVSTRLLFMVIFKMFLVPSLSSTPLL